MEGFVKEMIEEHSQLVLRIAALSDSVYNEENTDDKVEFANKAIQLSAMRKYEEALSARLENQGIVFVDGTYLEKVGEISSYAIGCGTEQSAGRKEEPTEPENHE